MPKPNRNFEKSKDFKGSMLRLFKSLDKWKYLLCFSLLLAMISAIIALIAPNKLSDLTDEISKGLVVNTKNLEKITMSVLMMCINSIFQVLGRNF